MADARLLDEKEWAETLGAFRGKARSAWNDAAFQRLRHDRAARIEERDRLVALLRRAQPLLDDANTHERDCNVQRGDDCSCIVAVVTALEPPR